MQATLLIPWFRAESWVVQLPLGERELTVEPFGVTALLGAIVGLIVALAFARKRQCSGELTLSLALYLVAFSFPISYLLNGLFYHPDKFFHVLSHPTELFGARLGLSMYGGILGCIVGALIWKWRSEESILQIGDAFAFAGPFGWWIARLGCFVTHDHPGRMSSFPLAVADFRTGTPPYEPRHDLGLYDAIVIVGIAIVFGFLAQKTRKPGFYVALLPLLYAPCRFMLDFLRASAVDGGDVRYGGLTPAQYGSVLLLIVGVLLMQRVLTSPWPQEGGPGPPTAKHR
jgi:phosphatidylglycerol:prolipoprotein diacylglycerol transferase